jgi:hypothetical protein
MHRFIDGEDRMQQALPHKPRCTPTKLRRVKRWVNEDVLDRMQDRLDRIPEAMGVRRQTVEHPFGTLKCINSDLV